MSSVAAVSVLLTCAAPEIVGWPVAGASVTTSDTATSVPAVQPRVVLFHFH